MTERQKKHPNKAHRPHGGNPKNRKGRKSSPKPQVSVRGKSDRYWIYGWHSAKAALANPDRVIKRVWLTANAQGKLESFKELMERAEQCGVEKVTGEMLTQMLAGDAVHQGIAVEVPALDDSNIERIIHAHAKGPAILLDQVHDPHNVGAILRSAAAFDSKGVVMTRRHGARESGVMARAAAGALETVPLVRVSNLVQGMLALKSAGFWCMGLDAHATDMLHDVAMAEKQALILGAEGKGLRRLTAEHCDNLVKLPMAPQMESLNVSNAAAVAMYECYKAVS